MIWLSDIIQRRDETAWKCPFNEHSQARPVGFNDACHACGQRRDGDGGRCWQDRANHDAIEAIKRGLNPAPRREPSLQERPY